MQKVDDSLLSALMQQAQAGDKRAYNELLTYISQMARGFVIHRIGQQADVEDIVQEILLSVHRSRDTYDNSRPFTPWLFTIARYRLTDHLRKHYKKADIINHDVNDMADYLPNSDVTDDNDNYEPLHKAVDNLPEKQRMIITMMKVEGYTAQEVSDKLGMSVSAVKVAAHRTYKQLKTQLEAGDG